MIVLLFKSRLRADVDEQDYRATRARMLDLVGQIPGFVSYKVFRGHEEFYESYSIQVCRSVRDYGWSRRDGPVSAARP